MLLKTIRSYLPFLIGLVVGLNFFSLDLVSPYSAHLPGDLVDARFNNYLLEHAHLFITGQTDSFWNAPFLYPEQNVITYSDNLLGSAPFYSLFRLLGCDREVSFQCWFILMSALNYACCYFLLVYVFKNNYASVLGAMVFAFSIALQSQMGHAQTFPRFAIPLTLLMAAMYLKELKPLYFFWTLFFLVYQFYCGLYLGFMLLIPVTLLFLCSIGFKWEIYSQRIKQLKWWTRISVSVIVNVILLLALMFPYLKRAQGVELYSYERVLQTVPTLRSYLYSHHGSMFWDFLKDMGVKYIRFWDHQVFAGGVAVLSFVVFAFVVLSKTFKLKMASRIEVTTLVKILFFTGLFTFLLFTRFQGYSLYRIIHLLPGFASMRAIQRIINIELVFYAIATAFVSWMLFKKERKYNGSLFVFFVGLVYADNHIHSDTTHRYTIESSQQRTNALLEKVKGLNKGSVFSYEPDSLADGAVVYQLDAMLVSQSAGLRTLNGYTANSPDEYSPYWERPNEASRLQWLRHKKLSNDSVVVIH